MTWHESAKAIAKFTELHDDWDGLGAIAPKLLTIQNALGLLIALRDAGDLSPPSRVAACPMGGIIIEWQMDGRYLEAEITPTGEVEWMEQVGEGPYRHWAGMDYVPAIIKKG